MQPGRCTFDEIDKYHIPIKAIVYHEDFNSGLRHAPSSGGNLENDVALLFLEDYDPKRFPQPIVPIELADPRALPTGKQVYAMGFGRDVELGTHVPGTFKVTNTTLLQRPACLDYMKENEVWATGKLDSHVCTIASNPFEGNACRGDSGGPLVAYQNDHWVQVGITHQTTKPNPYVIDIVCDPSRTPVIWVNPMKYKDWIQNTMTLVSSYLTDPSATIHDPADIGVLSNIFCDTSDVDIVDEGRPRVAYKSYVSHVELTRGMSYASIPPGKTVDPTRLGYKQLDPLPCGEVAPGVTASRTVYKLDQRVVTLFELSDGTRFAGYGEPPMLLDMSLLPAAPTLQVRAKADVYRDLRQVFETRLDFNLYQMFLVSERVPDAVMDREYLYKGRFDFNGHSIALASDTLPLDPDQNPYDFFLDGPVYARFEGPAWGPLLSDRSFLLEEFYYPEWWNPSTSKFQLEFRYDTDLAGVLRIVNPSPVRIAHWRLECNFAFSIDDGALSARSSMMTYLLEPNGGSFDVAFKTESRIVETLDFKPSCTLNGMNPEYFDVSL